MTKRKKPDWWKGGVKFLTTDQCASRWGARGHDADYYGRLARQGKLYGAVKKAGEWLIPDASVVAYFKRR